MTLDTIGSRGNADPRGSKISHFIGYRIITTVQIYTRWGYLYMSYTNAPSSFERGCGTDSFVFLVVSKFKVRFPMITLVGLAFASNSSRNFLLRRFKYVCHPTIITKKIEQKTNVQPITDQNGTSTGASVLFIPNIPATTTKGSWYQRK